MSSIFPRLFFLLFCATLGCLCSTRIFAMVINTRAPIYPIAEIPLDEVIQQKINQMQKTGEWQQHLLKANAKFQENVQQLPTLSFISKTQTPKTFYYNPSIIMPTDIKSADGKILIARGTLFNPLTEMSLDETLLFYDPHDAKQRCWAKKINTSIHGIKKFILVGGNWIKASNELNTRVYVDQEGRITRQLTIAHTPAMVTQAGLYLKISEVKPCP